MTATTNGTNGVHAAGGAPLQRAEELNTVSAESAISQPETSTACKLPQMHKLRDQSKLTCATLAPRLCQASHSSVYQSRR